MKKTHMLPFKIFLLMIWSVHRFHLLSHTLRAGSFSEMAVCKDPFLTELEKQSVSLQAASLGHLIHPQQTKSRLS